MSSGNITTQIPTTLGSWALLLAQAIESYGVDSDPIFKEAGVDKADIKKTDARFPTSSMVKLWHVAVERTGDPYIAIRVAQSFKPSAFSALGMAMAASLHVYDALKRAALYSHLIGNAAITVLEENADEVAFVMFPRPDLKSLTHIYGMSVYGTSGTFCCLYQMLRDIAGESLEVKAVHFEQSLVKELGYSLPTQFVKLLQQQAVLVEGKSNTVLDLGCGTGLVGQALPGHIKQLDGVDLSQAMLDIAGEKNIYHRLCKANAVDYLITHLLPYDIIIAADVLIYFGDLRALFSAVKNNSRPGSVFIFSIESLQCENYKLLKSGRFAHNPSYIENLLDEFEFTIESKVRTIIRKEHTTSLDGFIYLGLTEIFDTTHNPYPFGKRTAACLILARF